MSTVPKPRVLIVYYTFSQQTAKIVEAMADALTERGCDATKAEIEFTDPRYANRFSKRCHAPSDAGDRRYARRRSYAARPARSASRRKRGTATTISSSSALPPGG